MATQVDRWQEIRGIHYEYRFFYQIGGGLLLVILGILIGGAFFSADPDGYKANLYTEILGLIATVVILDRLAERREERRRILDLQERLVMEAGSQSNETVKRAVHELDKRAWLKGENSLLRRANLRLANLEGVDLVRADLRGADLVRTNLQGAKLWLADLREADLSGADLRGAELRGTTLQGANLARANLEGAELRGANLQGAMLAEAKLDKNTILPDGSKWRADSDLARFTDVQHPNFWHGAG
jgi:hypothetical protein